ncbi:MAG TPA: hypothetical protein VMV46_18240 [Thermoanaerobaculia bacterium]|nr:hypothetical protein [Thermoanaerobaculia bacterium]
MPDAFDPVELLRILVDHDVRFVVVGGVAGTLAGSPITTRDLDVVYQLAPDNIERLVTVLGKLNARYKDPAGRTILPDAAKLATVRVNLLSTDRGDLDLLRNIGESLRYEALLSRSVVYDLGTFEIHAIDLETLIEAKEYANRPKDHHGLPFLRALLELHRKQNDE